MMPDFMVCTSSPASGTTTTTVVSARPAISISLCPTPTVSTIISSKPATDISCVISKICVCSPPSAPLLASDLIYTFGWLYHSLILIRSPKSAPKLKGEEGSTQTTPTFFPAATQFAIKASTKVLLPAPGGPVIPVTVHLCVGVICNNCP